MSSRERERHVVRFAVLALVVGMVAAVVFGAMSAGTSQVAHAEPPTAGADAGDGEKRRSAKDQLKAKLLGAMLDLAAPLDPADPHYKRKLYQQVLANRLITKLGGGSASLSLGDIQGLLSDAFEIHRRSKQTVQGLRDRMSKVDKQIEDLRQRVANAKTKAQRDRADARLTQATNSRKGLNKLLKAAEHHARPFDRDAYIANLKRAIWGLEQQVNGKHDEKTKEKIKFRLDQARKDLEKAIEDRERNGDDGDEGGTPAKRPGPTQPPKNPSTTGADKTVTTPSAEKKSTLRTRFSRGGSPAAEAAGDLIEQIRADAAAEGHRRLLDQAVKDPKLRDRIVKEYLDLRDSGVGEDLTRPFDSTKQFTPGELRAVGPAAVDLHTGELATKSNADPVYRKAREDCGGYETCVKERARKLREDIADAEKKAKRSADDPVYQKARVDCGGHETCVKERVKKLRKDVTDAEKKAKRSAGDPLYQQAMRECGGYDTCVRDRVKKLRAQKVTEPKKATGPKKVTEPKKATGPKKAVANKQYEEASKVCGGYDTCVQDRLKKVRSADTKSKEHTAKPKQETTKPKKKTEK